MPSQERKMSAMANNDKDIYYATRFWGLSIGAADRMQKVIKLSKTIHAHNMLDVGCSGGMLTTIIKDTIGVTDVHGIEISVGGMSAANRRGIKAIQLDVDINPLPFNDNFFDFVYCGDVIEHLFNPSYLLNEIHRVIRIGGFFLITTPNLSSWYNRVMLLFGYQPFETAASLSYPEAGKFSLVEKNIKGLGGEHIRVMTLKALKDLMIFHNFKIEKIVGAHGVSSNQNMFMKAVQFVDELACISPSFATWFVIKAVKMN